MQWQNESNAFIIAFSHLQFTATGNETIFNCNMFQQIWNARTYIMHRLKSWRRESNWGNSTKAGPWHCLNTHAVCRRFQQTTDCDGSDILQ